MPRVLVILTALALLPACRKAPREPRFAIEVQAPGAATRVVVDEGLGSDSRIDLSTLLPASPSAELPVGWETLDLNYSTEGDRVKVGVYALHQEYDARRHAMVFKSQKLGAHLAKLRESVSLTELEKFGYRPFTLRVVPAK